MAGGILRLTTRVHLPGIDSLKALAKLQRLGKFKTTSERGSGAVAGLVGFTRKDLERNSCARA